MGLLCGCARRLTAKNGGFRPGQFNSPGNLGIVFTSEGSRTPATVKRIEPVRSF
jgi:hypothetical protein